MSKRAEEAAYNYVKKNGTLGCDYNQIYDAAMKGYEQAEKDTTRKVEKWLAEIHRVCDITDANGYRIELRDLTASLEKAMEEE